MSRFYIGQRLRIKWVHQPRHSHEVGQSGEIFEIVHQAIYGAGVRLKGFNGWYTNTQVEPITDSYDKSTWDRCVRKPEHLRVGV